jgi:hypothetical protein
VRAVAGHGEIGLCAFAGGVDVLLLLRILVVLLLDVVGMIVEVPAQEEEVVIEGRGTKISAGCYKSSSAIRKPSPIAAANGGVVCDA